MVLINTVFKWTLYNTTIQIENYTSLDFVNMLLILDGLLLNADSSLNKSNLIKKNIHVYGLLNMLNVSLYKCIYQYMCNHLSSKIFFFYIFSSEQMKVAVYKMWTCCTRPSLVTHSWSYYVNLLYTAVVGYPQLITLCELVVHGHRWLPTADHTLILSIFHPCGSFERKCVVLMNNSYWSWLALWHFKDKDICTRPEHYFTLLWYLICIGNKKIWFYTIFFTLNH